MRCICRICGLVVFNFRSSHLRDGHGIDTDKGSVKEYFLHPEEVGVPRSRELKEGEKVSL